MTVVERQQQWRSKFVMEAVVVVMTSMVSVGEFELWFDDVRIFRKAFVVVGKMLWHCGLRTAKV